MSKTTTIAKPAPTKEVEETTETEAPEVPQDLLDKSDALLEEIDTLIEEVKPAQRKSTLPVTMNLTVPATAAEPPLTLANAIRLGAKRAPQAFNRWYGEQGETCALAAAYSELKARGIVP